MVQRKYALPRHTNLARQGKRTGAFLIDLAIWVLMTLVLFFGCFHWIFNPTIKRNDAIINEERINSGLYVANEQGQAELISSDKEYTEFFDSLKYYYFNYLPGNDIKEGLAPCQIKDDSKASAEWFNRNVLEIEVQDSYQYFEYVKVGDEVDKTQIGVVKEDAVLANVSSFLQKKYQSAIIEDFNTIEYVAKAGEIVMFYSALGVVISAFLAAIVTYIVLPWVLKNGQSVGKKVYGLGLADIYGYKYKNTQLLMRFMPLGVCILSVILLVFVNIYLDLAIFLIIFLVSFALAMASPKKTSLHDLTARTIVVDLKDSILFENEIEEEQYILKEDNLLDDVVETNEDGEEPELRYEK